MTSDPSLRPFLLTFLSPEDVDLLEQGDLSARPLQPADFKRMAESPAPQGLTEAQRIEWARLQATACSLLARSADRFAAEFPLATPSGVPGIAIYPTSDLSEKEKRQIDWILSGEMQGAYRLSSLGYQYAVTEWRRLHQLAPNVVDFSANLVDGEKSRADKLEKLLATLPIINEGVPHIVFFTGLPALTLSEATEVRSLIEKRRDITVCADYFRNEDIPTGYGSTLVNIFHSLVPVNESESYVPTAREPKKPGPWKKRPDPPENGFRPIDHMADAAERFGARHERK